jgi:hypothetical protein
VVDKFHTFYLTADRSTSLREAWDAGQGAMIADILLVLQDAVDTDPSNDGLHDAVLLIKEKFLGATDEEG